MNALESLGRDIWIADGPAVRCFGFPFTTRMTIVKLRNGSLWVNSPVVLPFEELRRISELGTVKYLVAGTQLHEWRLEAWHSLFPDAQLWAAPRTLMNWIGGRFPFARILEDNPNREWAEDLDQLEFEGSRLIKEVVFLHKDSGTVIMDDLIQIHSRTALFILAGVAEPAGGVGIDIRLSFTNRKLARSSLEKLLSWNFDKLIIAHGPCIRKDAKSFVERAFRWLR